MFAMQNLKSPEVFEFLIQIYIQVLKSNSDPNVILKYTIKFWEGNPTKQQLFEAVANITNALGKSSKPLEYLKCLLYHLENGRIGNTEDILELYRHPNPYISHAAGCALRKIKHPVIINEIIQKCQNIQLYDVMKLDRADLRALARSEESVAENVCLNLLDMLSVHHDCDCFSMIAVGFSCTKHYKVVQKLVNLGINLTCDCATKTLCSLALHSPEVVKDIILSKNAFWEANPVTRTRAIIALALCGDKNVNGELFAIFVKWLSILATPSIKRHILLKDQYLSSYLKQAAVKANIKEIKPLLKIIAKKVVAGPLKEYALELLQDYELYYPSKKVEINWLFHELNFNSKHADLPNELIDKWVSKMEKSWPMAKIQEAVEYAFRASEIALQNGDIKTACFFGYAAGHFKDYQHTRRFLHIFRGWPGFLPKKL